MTVTQIVEDLLKYNYITAEAATVLLKAEIEAKKNTLFTHPNTYPFLGAPHVKYESSGTNHFPVLNQTSTDSARTLTEQLKNAISNDTI